MDRFKKQNVCCLTCVSLLFVFASACLQSLCVFCLCLFSAILTTRSLLSLCLIFTLFDTICLTFHFFFSLVVACMLKIHVVIICRCYMTLCSRKTIFSKWVCEWVMRECRGVGLFYIMYIYNCLLQFSKEQVIFAWLFS